MRGGLSILILALLISASIRAAMPTSANSEEQALLRAIWSQPDDDTPRLVYADWLDEHNDPERAEFIRLQCEQARSFTKARNARIDALLAKNSKKWIGSWTQEQIEGIRIAEVKFSRGFIEHVRVAKPQMLIDQPDRFFAEFPFLRALDLDGGYLPIHGPEGVERAGDRTYDGGNLAHSLARRPELARITALRYAPPLHHALAFWNDNQFQLVLSNLPALRELDYFGPLNTGSLQALSVSPQARQLEFLSLRGLTTSPSVQLQGDALHAHRVALRALLTARPFPELRELRVNDPQAADVVAESLIDPKHFPKLRAILMEDLFEHLDSLQHFLRGDLSLQLRYMDFGIGGRPHEAIWAHYGHANHAGPPSAVPAFNMAYYQTRIKNLFTAFAERKPRVAEFHRDVEEWDLGSSMKNVLSENKKRSGCDDLVRALTGEVAPLPRFLGIMNRA